MIRTFAFIALAIAAGVALGQNRPVYVGLPPAKALYYTPDSGPPPTIAFLIVHRTANYLQHIGCRELSARGFGALCMNTRFDNNELLVDWDRIALDVKAGVEFLRKQPGIERVVLFGHSGGGPTLSFYQAVAENGLAFCKDPGKIVACRDDLASLPKADALILADAHPGVPVILLRSLNGAVVDETPKKFDPSLDPYNPANGYSANGSSTYSPEFQSRYYAAQSKRMNVLIDAALTRQKAIQSGSGPYPDNDIFVIPHGGNPGAGPGGASQLHSLDVKIGVPLLVVGMGGYLFIRDSEEEFENAKSPDKELIFIEGATHGFTPCAACGPPNAYSNSVRNMFDHVRDWTVKRLMAKR